jgi:hypothetical protein
LPATQPLSRGLQVLGADLRHRAELELGATLLPLQVGADPPAQQAHRAQRVKPPAHRPVMAIAILEPAATAWPMSAAGTRPTRSSSESTA